MLDFGKKERKKGPEEGKNEDEYDIDANAYPYRKIAIVNRHRRNPVEEKGIKAESRHKS